jgi:adenylate kinase family enzyme
MLCLFTILETSKKEMFEAMELTELVFHYLYAQIANSVNEGRLVPEDIIFGLLTKRLEEGYHKGEIGFILDGVPRTRMQAVSIHSLCMLVINCYG